MYLSKHLNRLPFTSRITNIEIIIFFFFLRRQQLCFVALRRRVSIAFSYCLALRWFRSSAFSHGRIYRPTLRPYLCCSVDLWGFSASRPRLHWACKFKHENEAPRIKCQVCTNARFKDSCMHTAVQRMRYVRPQIPAPVSSACVDYLRTNFSFHRALATFFPVHWCFSIHGRSVRESW